MEAADAGEEVYECIFFLGHNHSIACLGMLGNP